MAGTPTLRREWLDDDDMGPILQEVEAGQCPKQEDIPDHSSIYKSYWAQQICLLETGSMLECQ
jgi:hypothetical protein